MDNKTAPNKEATATIRAAIIAAKKPILAAVITALSFDGCVTMFIACGGDIETNAYTRIRNYLQLSVIRLVTRA